MTEQEIKELAIEAAKTSVLAASRFYRMNSIESVDHFLNAYEYATKKLFEKCNQSDLDQEQDIYKEKNRFNAIREGTAEFKHGKRL